MKVIRISSAIRKQAHKRTYSKQAEREAAKSLPPAWKIGDRKSFAATRARVMAAICRDGSLSGKAKAVLSTCIEHMNHENQLSCYCAMPTIAKEAGVGLATCWRTIRKAEGNYIVTRRGKRYRDHGYTATEITIHPRFGNVPATENCISNLKSSLETASQSCDKLHLKT